MIRCGYIKLWGGRELYLTLPLQNGWAIVSLCTRWRLGRVKPTYKPWVTRWLFGPIKVEWHAKIGREGECASAIRARGEK